MNRVITITDAKGAVTRYTYTATGDVKTVTDALGNVLNVKNPLGNTDSFTYDALGRIKTDNTSN